MVANRVGMKRELAVLLEGQTRDRDLPGRTRASRVRIDPCSVIAGKIEGFFSGDDCRVNGLVNHSDGMEIDVSDCNGELGNARIKCGLGRSMLEEESGREVGDQDVNKEELDDDTVIDNGKIQSTPLRRFTRSLMNPNVVPMDNLESGAIVEVIPKPEEAEHAELSSGGRTSMENLQLTLPKRMDPFKVPSTIKEILETGLLEGLLVTYYDGKKVSRLEGRIKGIGILCSCLLCKGLEVVLPSKFELHAIKKYRHVSKYTYLENGKSLHDVLEACKNSPLDTLENTIQTAIGVLPLTKPIICKKCKVPFIAPCATEVGSLCNSCMESKEPVASPSCTTGRKAGSSKGKVVSKSLKSTSLCNSQEKNKWKITKKNQGLHKLVFDEGGLPDGTELAYFSRGKKLLEGYKKGAGIFCLCCNSVVSASTFEGHAGWASRKKPYTNIYTSNGVSLHELAIHLSKGRKYSPEDSDDICIVCRDGGNLLLCDGCPRAFHRECACLSTVPRGNWYCSYCQNMFQREKFVEHNANALAAGRISGVDSIDQISRRCIRIFKNPESEISTCVLCRSCEFSKSSYGPRTIIICDQCEMEFHVGCLKDHGITDLKEIPLGKWFCCMECTRIHSTLQKLLVSRSEKLPDYILNVIKTEPGSNGSKDLNVRWRLLSGKYASPEVRFLLSKAVDIFHDCFSPIVDPTSGQDIIPPMIYGRNIRDQEFGGMYCAVLMVDSSVVSAGVIRVYGREVAELPLVATCKEYQGKGYFQILFNCIMKLLAFCNVKSIVLPAAHEAESLWLNKFGFNKIAPLQLSKLRKSCTQMITFKGTNMLQKTVPECRILP